MANYFVLEDLKQFASQHDCNIQGKYPDDETPIKSYSTLNLLSDWSFARHAPMIQYNLYKVDTP